MSDVMPTIAVMPMTMPSTVRPERILFVRTVSNAMTMTSLKRSTRNFMPSPASSFSSKRFDRIETRSARGGIQPEEQADERRDADAERDRPGFNRGGNRRGLRDCQRDRRPEKSSDPAAEYRKNDRLGQQLRHDVAPLGAERFAKADLACPLGDDHQHDVHDDDAADDERQADDADEDREDAVGGRVVDADDGVGGECPEVVRLLWLQPAGTAQRQRGLVLRSL